MNPSLKEINSTLEKLQELLEATDEHLKNGDLEHLKEVLRNAAHTLGYLGHAIGNTLRDLRFAREDDPKERPA